nr:splicing factor 3b subunit 3 [Cryptomonas curvata]
MHIGYISIQQSTYVPKIIEGSFLKTKKREIVLSRSSFIEIFIFKKKNGKMISFLVINLFSQIIFHTSFCFKNDYTDYLFIFEKNGNIIIIKIETLKKFVLIDSMNLKKFSKTKNFYGSNLALDKKNMNFMVCGIQTAKFISCIKQNDDLIPIFSNKSFEIKQTFIICHDIVNIEPESINLSKFATIETFYSRPYEKTLVLYYIDFVSKNIKRKVICQLNNTSYSLIYISNKTSKKGLIAVLSEGFFTFINLLNLEILIKILPFKRKKNQNKMYQIISFSSFITNKKAFYLFATEDGDLLKFNLSFKFKNNHLIFNPKFEYLDSIEEKICCVKILSSGFIFLSMEAGNHLYFQFVSFKKKKYQNIDFCFFPRYNCKNILLLEEFLQNLPIISADFIDSNRQFHFLFLCGTKTKSSIRLLNYSCLVKRILCKKLKNFPLAINIIKKNKNFFYILVSFEIGTTVFYLNKRLGEVNNSFFSTNSPTILTQYIHSRQGIFQSTKIVLRFIKIFPKKNKISEWKPSQKTLIINSTILEKNIVHIFIIISSFKGILLEVLKDGSFIELEFVNLINSKFIILFGISIKTEEKMTWDFIIFCGREEKSIRTYSFKKNSFMKLIGVQLLSWYPISAKFFSHDKKNFLLISLDDGQLVYGSFDNDTGRVKIQKNIKITNFPLYISNGNFSSKMLCFGSKLWIVGNNISKKNSIKQISNKTVDLAECCTNIIVSIYKNKIDVFENKNKFGKIYKFFLFDIFSTPIDVSLLNKNKRSNFICFICSEISHKFLNHQINLNKRKKSFLDSLFFFKNKKDDCSNILFITSFFQSKIEKKNFDFVLYRGANMNKHWKNVYLVKLYSSVQTVIVSSILSNYLDKNYSPLNRLTENKGKLSSLLCFYIRKKLEYNPNRGGRVGFKNKFCFVFEKIICYEIVLNFNCIIGKKLLGKRFTVLNGNFISVMEIKLDKFQTIFQFNGSFFCLLEMDILKNIVLTLDSIQGFKIFTIISKKKSVKLLGENYLLNNLSYGKIIDPLTFILSDKLGNVYLFRQQSFGSLCKKINLAKRCNNFLKLICQITASSPVIKTLTKNYFVTKRNAEIYLICMDGTIILLKPILNIKNIFCLEKIYSNFNTFFKTFNKWDDKKKYKILFETTFRCYKVDALLVFFQQKLKKKTKF